MNSGRDINRAQAAVLVAPNLYELREYPVPEPGPGCALVRMELSGICGTDKHTFQGYTTQYAGSGTPRQIPFPIIQGHENVGRVVAFGEGYIRSDFDGVPLAEGDRVVVGPNIACGHCYYCRRGFAHYWCEQTRDYGNNISAADPPHLFGGWAQYLCVLPGSFLVRVPEELPPELAVLAELMAVTVGLDRGKQFSAVPTEPFLFDDTVVLLGVDPMGMCFLMKARMLGAGTVIAIDKSGYRLGMAQRLGADYSLDAHQTQQDERMARVRELTHGRGADVVVECAGVPSVIPEALEMLRPGGLLVEAGNFSDLGNVSISPHRHLCSKGVRILGVGGEEAAAYGPSMRQLARFQKHYPVSDLISHRYPLREVETAMRKSMAPDSMKVVLDPWNRGEK